MEDEQTSTTNDTCSCSRQEGRRYDRLRPKQTKVWRVWWRYSGMWEMRMRHGGVEESNENDMSNYINVITLLN